MKDPRYKFKSLNVYSSVEWMFGTTKKYRRVFEREEVNYIYAELSLFNKYFDEQDWACEVKLIAQEITDGQSREICDQKEQVAVKQDDNVVYVRKGWGTDKYGGFWRKGVFKWLAYIDNTFVGEQIFYVEDVGKVTPLDNPYFDVLSLKLYNGPYDGVAYGQRTYLRKFNRDKTLYIWAELTIRNKINDTSNLEFFFNFYDDAGQLKGQTVPIHTLPEGKKDSTYTYTEGWGSRDGGSWKNEKYTCEIVFMDTLIAAVSFEVGEEEIEGECQLYNSPLPQQTTVANDKNDGPNSEARPQTMEEIMQELNGLVGLSEVKLKIANHIKYLDFLRVRREKGFDEKEHINLHSVFTGNPGTGKTTVVNLLGKIYFNMGLLSKGHVVSVDRADLVGEYIGQTAPLVKKAIKNARGGILFIDEAYSLMRDKDDTKDYGKEVIEILIKEMSDGVGDIAIMAAGYPAEMQKFIDYNPGLKSRFSYYFHFEDYTPDELSQIAQFAAKKLGVRLNDGAIDLLDKILIDAYRDRDRSFGNARFAHALIAEAKMNLGLRLMEKSKELAALSNDDLMTVTEADIQHIKSVKTKTLPDIPIDTGLLRVSLSELDTLIGLDTIKNDVNELTKLVAYYREMGKDVLNRFSLHTVFTGNPGTGKTTIARIMGRIFKALGLLERGHVIETDREGLIAGYIGQTAIKTKAKIDEAMGGVLFIDEAYSLVDSQNSYGSEAIEVILKNMEDSRGKFAVIVAGYPHEMTRFLDSNPGLKSRFDRTFVFEDYAPEQLMHIALRMLEQEELAPDPHAHEAIMHWIRSVYASRDKYFGNAREVRKLVERAIKNQHLRMASLPASARTKEMLCTLIAEDLQNIPLTHQPKQRPLGFRS